MSKILPPKEASLMEPPSVSTEDQKKLVINWYRTPMSPAEFKALHRRSDFKAFVQTLGYLGILAATGGLSLYSFLFWPWWVTLGALFLHGMVTAFLINAVHELGHGTVFKTRWLNAFFTHITAFLGWIHHDMFQDGHIWHHRSTLHSPDDLQQGLLPTRLSIRDFLISGFVQPNIAWSTLKDTIRIARSRFHDNWERELYPLSAPEKSVIPVRWARILLAGHGIILLASLLSGLWIFPFITTLAPFYGGWLFFLCNNTQHIGLPDNVPDFRLCCRTFTLNPLVRFLYWQMNYHTEHHMYAAVPCYHLKRLHALIKHDMPPCPHGLIAVWREISAIQARQKKDPSYRYIAIVPSPAAK